MFFIFISNFIFLEGGDKYVSLSPVRFVERFSCHDSTNLLSVVGWLGSSSLLLCEDCFSLSPNACVKILVSVFDIFRSFFEYKSINCLCEPRLYEYVLLMYSATVAQRSVLSSLFCSEKYFGMTVSKFSFLPFYKSVTALFLLRLQKLLTACSIWLLQKVVRKVSFCIVRAEVFIICVFNNFNI